MSRNEMETEEYSDVHPALREDKYNRLSVMAGHGLKGTAKGALIGGAVGGAAGLGVFAATSMMTAGALMAIPIVGPIAGLVVGGGAIASGAASAAATYMAIKGATIGAGLGAAGGGLMAASNMSEAADAEEDRLVAKYEQAQARQDRLARLREARDRQMIAMERQETMMRGQNLNQGLPRMAPGQGQGMTA